MSRAFDPDDTTKPQRAARPRRAATLILIDEAGGEPRVLMGRRGTNTRFMPGKYVFPGGRVDRGDYRARIQGDLTEAERAALAPAFPDSAARAAAAAAIRETFEETGYALARRQAGLTTRSRGWAPFYADCGAPDLGPVKLLARAVTPPYRPIRYDTLFFTAPASHAEQRHDGLTPELEDVGWRTLTEARAADLPAITAFVLDILEARLKDPNAAPPFIRMARGKHVWTPMTP